MRTSAQLTQPELDTFRDWIEKHPQYDTTQNGQAIADYILNTWNEQISEYTLDVAVQKLQEAGRLEVLSPVRVSYLNIARQDLERAEALHSWYVGQGTLVKDGDDSDGDLALENQAAILSELRGRPITETTILQAIGRIRHSGRGRLHFNPTIRPVDPRQHQSDGRGFMPKDETNVPPHQRAAEARRETAQARGETPARTEESANDRAFRLSCEGLLRHGTHGCQAAMAEAFNRRGDKSWRSLYSEMQGIARSYDHLINRKAF